MTENELAFLRKFGDLVSQDGHLNSVRWASRGGEMGISQGVRWASRGIEMGISRN